MGLQRSLGENSPDGAVTDINTLRPDVFSEQRRGPMGHGDADVLRWLRRFCFNARRVGFGEREGGRPERGASANIWFGASVLLNRCFHLKTVRTWIPTRVAMSSEPTPAAISNRACPRRASRCSVERRRIVASAARCCSSESGSGAALGPGWERSTHRWKSIMARAVVAPATPGQISAARH
jgi:hypothetical protein